MVDPMNFDELKSFSVYLQKEFAAPDFLTLIGKPFVFTFASAAKELNSQGEYNPWGKEVLIGTVIGVHIEQELYPQDYQGLAYPEDNNYKMNLRVDAPEISDGIPYEITGFFYPNLPEDESNERICWMLDCLKNTPNAALEKDFNDPVQGNFYVLD